MKPPCTTELLNAIRDRWSDDDGGLEAVRGLILGGAPVNTADKMGGTALGRAASLGTAPVVGLLLQFGATLDARNALGCLRTSASSLRVLVTPAHLPASGRRLLLHALLLHDHVPSLPPPVAHLGPSLRRRSPFHCACSAGHAEVAVQLTTADAATTRNLTGDGTLPPLRAPRLPPLLQE